MKSSPLSIAILLVGLVAGYLVGAGSGERQANAQAPAAAPAAGVGRYQISSWGSQSYHGCYILDTASGELWKVDYETATPKKVANKLP